ncbi:RNA-helicase, putative, partial [Plasmodium malariae]
LKKEGLVSIEKANPVNLKILCEDDLKKTEQEKTADFSEDKKEEVKEKTKKNSKKLVLNKTKKAKKTPSQADEKNSEKGELIKVGKKKINKKEENKKEENKKREDKKEEDKKEEEREEVQNKEEEREEVQNKEVQNKEEDNREEDNREEDNREEDNREEDNREEDNREEDNREEDNREEDNREENNKEKIKKDEKKKRRKRKRKNKNRRLLKSAEEEEESSKKKKVVSKKKINKKAEKSQKENKKRQIKNKRNGTKGEDSLNKNNENKKKERFDIHALINNEDSFKNIKDIKCLIVYKRWNMNKSIDIFYSILKGLYDNKFWKPTEIQMKTLEEAISFKNDIVAISKTGTGKTLTFCLPILNNLVKKKLMEYAKKQKSPQKFRGLILVPTRELALQILNHFGYINKYINLYITTLIGGININKQKRIISKKPEIIICTPGRLRYFLELEEKINYIFEMKNIRYFACDEIDKMIETSFIKDISFISKHLYKSVGGKKRKFVQTFLISATLGLTVQLQNENLAKFLNVVTIRKENSTVINISDENAGNGSNSNCILPAGLTLNIAKCEKSKILQKLYYLLTLYFNNELTSNDDKKKVETNEEEKKEVNMNEKMQNEEDKEEDNIKKVIIFVNTIKRTRELFTVFRYLFFDQALETSLPKKHRSNIVLKNKVKFFSVHSQQKLKYRVQSIFNFSQSNCNSVLFCTDVLSRGIDLDKCDLIIQLNCPVNDVTFVHRSGRTARNFKTGKCICFVADDEVSKWANALKKIGLNFEEQKELEELKRIDDKDSTKIKRALLYCAQLVKMNRKMKERSCKLFFRKLAELADLEGECDFSSDSDDQYANKADEEIYKQMIHSKKMLYKILYED